MEKSETVFKAKQLYEILASNQSTLLSCLEDLRSSFEKRDITYIYQTISVIHDVIQSSNQLPQTKYNSLVVVQLLISTVSYSTMTFIEILLLPMFIQVSNHEFHKRRQQDTQCFFSERGYRDSIGIRKVSRKYVTLAIQILFLAAAIKPNQNVLFSEVNSPSRFELSIRKLKQKKICVKQHNKVFEFRVKYLQQLKNVSIKNFSDFMNKTLKQQILFKQSISSILKKLIDSQDSFITIPIINACNYMLTNMAYQFPQKKHYLSLFNSFIKQGDIYAITVLNNSTFIKEIFGEIVTVRGDQSISNGKLIYPQIDASIQDKLDFYCEFLKNLQIWANFIPATETGEVSQIKTAYDYLKNKKKFIFPETNFIKKMKKEFQDNLKKKEERNSQMLKFFQKDDDLLEKFRMINSNLIGEKEASNQSFQKLLSQVEMCFQNLLVEKKIDKNIEYLKQFRKQWQTLKQNYKEQIDQQSLQRGDQFQKKISTIYPLYLKLKRKSMMLDTFRTRIASIVGFSFASSQFQSIGEKYSNDYESNEQQKGIQKSCTKRQIESQNLELGCQSRSQSQVQDKQLYSKSLLKVINSLLIKNSKLENQQMQLNHSNKSGFFATQNKKQQSHLNQYGIVQLLKKRNPSRSNKLSKQLDNNLKILPSQLLRSQCKQSQTNSSKKVVLNHKQKIDKNSLSIQMHRQKDDNQYNIKPFIEKHRYSSDRLIENNSKVFQIYQIQSEQIQNNKTSRHQTNLSKSNNFSLDQSGNLGSKLSFQKIVYHSTNQAIQSYKSYVNRSCTNENKNSTSGSRTTNKSIIKKQYQKINSKEFHKSKQQFNVTENIFYSKNPKMQNIQSFQEDKLQTSKLRLKCPQFHKNMNQRISQDIIQENRLKSKFVAA